jgi:choline dehydrogenase-like flavoprotein
MAVVNNYFDVIIIGTGAGGATLAHRLAPAGSRILLLERGDYLPRHPDNWDSTEVFVRNRYRSPETWLDKADRPFHPAQHYFVGGQTKFYGAVLFRQRERDFGAVQHHGGLSPAWPLSYTDFAPYYDQAERLYLVHGERGEDPTEPPATGPYPYPAVSHEPRIQQLHEDLVRIGHTPFHLPLGVNLDESNPEKSPCVRCSHLDGFPCLVDGKADAHVLCVRQALQYPNVTLETNAKVVRLETDTSGRTVTGVVVESPAGERQTYTSDIVVVACGAINSALLLLQSATDRHPNGLANSSDLVGRNYMAHVNSAVITISKEPNPTRFQKTLGLNDFYWGADDFDFPLGHIQMLGKTDGKILKSGAPRFVPGFARELVARHALDFWLTTEDLPRPSNRVTLDRRGQIRLHYTDTSLEPHRRLLQKLKEMLARIEMHPQPYGRHVVRHQRIPIEGVSHQCGTVRFGTDPRASVLDVNCKAHDLDNLYVVDTGFFPSSSAVNPGLTAMANALRVGDHLLERLGTARSTNAAATPLMRRH